jgi:hypothetical protein
MWFHLEEVREIDKHIVTRLLLSTCNIETDSDDVEALPPFRKLVLHCESVQSRCRKRDNIRQSQNRSDALDFAVRWQEVSRMWAQACGGGNRKRKAKTLCRRRGLPLAIVCSLDSVLPPFPKGPLMRACAMRWLQQAWNDLLRTSLLAPCPTYDPCTIAAPVAVSPKETSFTMVFSSTTVPHCTQKPFPAAASYSMTVPPQSLHTT